jgi:hypothetical protein
LKREEKEHHERSAMKKFGAVLWLALLLNAVAVAQKFPEYPVQSASQYASCQTRDGIRMAVEPVGDKETQKKYFGTKFESHGFLPVLVVLENDSAGGSLILRRELVTYHVEDAQAKSISGGPATVGSKAGQGMAVGAGVALATTSAMGVALPVMIIGLKMIAGASQVKQNILVKELRSQTIAPGKAGSGFLYVPIGKPGPEKRKVTLNIPISSSDKQEAVVFTFNLELPGAVSKDKETVR